MRVQMLLVVASSFVWGCGEKVDGRDTSTIPCAKGKIPHLEQCFDSISLDDRTIGFKLSSKDGDLVVHEKLDQRWLDDITRGNRQTDISFTHFSDIERGSTMKSCGEFCEYMPLVIWGITSMREDENSYLDFIWLSLHFLVGKRSLHRHETWFAEGTIRLNGHTYDLPLHIDTVKAAYPAWFSGSEDDENTIGVDNGKMKLVFGFYTQSLAEAFEADENTGMVTSIAYGDAEEKDKIAGLQ